MANQTPPHTAGDPTDDEGGERAHEVDEQRDRLGATLLSLGDAVIATDARGQITLLNPVAESLTGWAEREARGLPIESVFRIVNEVTRELVDQPVKRVIELGILQKLPERTILITKDGLELSIDDSAAPIRGERGSLDEVALIFRDIADRRDLEKGLEDTRRYGEVIGAMARDPLVLLDEDLRVMSANHSFYATFQVSPEDTEGRSFFDLGDGQWNIPRLRVMLEELLAEDTSFDDFEVDHVFPVIGPRTMLLHARNVPREGDWGKTILLDIEDVTESSRMTRAVVASEMRYQRVFETAKDGILILDADTGAIVDANPFLLDMLGYWHADILGKYLWDIGLLGDIDASRVSFRELQEKGYVRYEDLPLEARDGRRVEVEFVSNVYRVDDRMVIQCNIRDVTKRRRAEEELRQAKEAAEEASRAKDRFLATLSHELRTPLTPVLATVSYVEMMPGLPAGLREELASIRRNVELEGRLIDDLLDVTRIGRGKLELHREALDVHASLRTALEVCQSEVEAKKLEISLALGAEAHHVWADPARMQQIFWNLIKNAVKFTPPAGRISLRSADVGVGRVAIEVADTGIGIEPKVLPLIFDAFEQGDQSVARKHGGLGLGLSIAKMLVDLHGGALTVTSEGRHRGSVFRVELETISILKDQEQTPNPAAGAEEGLLKVLLIDDNAETLRTITLLLRSSGFDVRTGTSVESAIAMLDGERFDLLVSDIGLPDGSGLDIMRHGRDRLGLKGIAFTGYGTDQDIQASKEAGFAHHLAKPSDLGLLVNLIGRTAS